MSGGHHEGREDDTRIRDINTAYGVLRQDMIDNGFGDVIALADAYKEINTVVMKHVAEHEYGTSPSARDRRVERYHPDVRLDAPDIAQVPTTIRQVSEETYDGLIGLREHWKGEAFQSFDTYIARLREVSALEAARTTYIGDALFEIAETSERASEEMEATIWGAAGMLLTGGGIPVAIAGGTTTLTGGLSLLVAVASGIVMVGDTANQANSVRGREMGAYADVALDLDSPEVVGRGPSELMPLFPDDIDEWEQKPWEP